MNKGLILAFFAVLALAGCGYSEQSGNGSTVDSTPAFIQAKNGTLYSIACLQGEGSKIAAGVSGAGESCAADQLNETQVRGIRAANKTTTQYFYYINPATYYGGSQTNNFCGQYFGYSWNGCYNWLGYTPSYYNSSYYQPSCGSCTNVSVNINYGYGYGYNYPYQYQNQNQNSCPSSCSAKQTWASQPFYQNWNSWNWWYSW